VGTHITLQNIMLMLVYNKRIDAAPYEELVLGFGGKNVKYI